MNNRISDPDRIIPRENIDFGLDASAPLDDVLPLRTLRAAASLQHWVVENAKTARALPCRRAGGVVSRGSAAVYCEKLGFCVDA